MAVSIVSSCSEPPEANQPKAIARLNGDDYAQVEKRACGRSVGRSLGRTRASICHLFLLLLQNELQAQEEAMATR